MTIIEALLGEHGAIYPLLERIEITAPSTDLSGLKIQASPLQSTLISHANLEDELLRPAILPYLPRPCLTGTDDRCLRTTKLSGPDWASF